MNKFSLFGLSNLGLAGILFTTLVQSVQAGRTVSMTEIDCLTTSASSGVNSFIASSGNVSLGQEVFTAVAVLRTDWEFLGSNYIRSDIPASAACRITPSGSKPRFRTLRLAFGINNGNSYAKNNSLIKLTVFLDGNAMGSQEMAKGEQKFWLVNVTNVRSVALRADCLSRDTCPSVVFVQTLLEE